MGVLLALVVLLVRSAAFSDAMTSRPKGFTIQGKVIWPGTFCSLIILVRMTECKVRTSVLYFKTITLKVEVKQTLRQQACCKSKFQCGTI